MTPDSSGILQLKRDLLTPQYSTAID